MKHKILFWVLTWLLGVLPAILDAQVARAPGDTIHAYNICFPADVTVTDCGPPPSPNILMDELGNCDMLAVNITETVYPATGGTCSKIYRTYMVIDWCAYTDACGTQEQQVFVVNRDAPDADGVLGEGVCVLVRDANEDGYPEVYYSTDLVADPAEQILFPTPCAPNAHPIWSYTQIINIVDTERPVIQAFPSSPFSVNASSCRGTATLLFQVTDNCTGPVALQTIGVAAGLGGVLQSPTVYASTWTIASKVTALGAGVYQVVLDGLPAGTYQLGLLFRDDCGNLSLNTRITFEMVDEVGPTPVCMHGLSGSLMPDGLGGGMLTVDASTFVIRPTYDCAGQGPQTLAGNSLQKLVRTYSINRWGELPNQNQSSLTFNCSDALNYIPVEIHAWDTLGNNGYCQTYIEIQDNGFICAPSPDVSIAGTVATESKAPVAGVEIRASGDTQQVVTTNSKGAFRFSKLKQGYDYSFTPVLDKDIRQGITGRDLLLLQQQLMGIPVLRSPYKWIAADIDRSGTLTMTDLKLLQAVFLKKMDKFPNNTSWRFVDAQQAMPMPVSGLLASIPESRSVNDFHARDTGVHFIAIKVGDLDESVVRDTTVRRKIELDVADASVRVGGVVSVPIKLAGKESGIDGIAVDIDVDTEVCHLLGIQEGALTTEEFSWDPETGILSIAALDKSTLAGGEALFTLILEANQDVVVHEVLRLSSGGEGVVLDSRTGVENNVALRFEAGSSLDLGHTVRPNPFREEVAIQFEMPVVGEAELQIRDAQGRLVFREKRTFGVGTQSWGLLGNRFKVPGLYGYLLSGTWGAVSGKLLKLD